MALNPQIADITYRQTVVRKMPKANLIILVLLYVCVAIFTFLGTMWGTLMLIPSLGTLFFAWYYKGVISVSYEYQLDGYDLHIRRLSGTRSKPVNEAFAYVDLQRVIVIADEDLDEEKLMEDVMEAGGDDFKYEDGVAEIVTAPNDFPAVRDALYEMGYRFESADVAYVPQTTTAIDDPDNVTKMTKLLDMLEENDDVQNVWHNWDMPEEDEED